MRGILTTISGPKRVKASERTGKLKARSPIRKTCVTWIHKIGVIFKKRGKGTKAQRHKGEKNCACEPVRLCAFVSIPYTLFLSCLVWLMLSFSAGPCLCLPITVIKQVISPSILAARKKEIDRIPELPTFHAPILQQKRKVISSPELPGDFSKAKNVVQRNLAESGLLKTLLKVMREVPELSYQQNGRANKSLLEEIGLPVRLLSCYSSDDPPIAGLDQIVASIAKQSLKKGTGDVMKSQGTGAVKSCQPKWKFDFVPSLPGFKLLPENGVCRIEAMRMQLYPLDYAKGPGDGCIVDIVRQMLLCTSHEKFLISVCPCEVNPFTGLLQAWNVPNPERIILMEDESVSSQWAQDNCKTGTLFDQWGGRFREYITLVPRFASVGEDYSEYRPSESFIFDQIQRAGWRVVQSPLLFQGGNVLPVKNLKTGELIVFAGQAELVRNTRLGLKPEEVLEAFRKEWGADRIEVLPPLSFHIDLEVSFRWHNGKLIAFVNDSMSAARLIVKCGIKGLCACSLLPESEARELIWWLEHSERAAEPKYSQLLQILWSKVNEFRDEKGQFASDQADSFVISDEESGSANLSRFLLGLDLLSAAHKEGKKFWGKLAGAPMRRGGEGERGKGGDGERLAKVAPMGRKGEGESLETGTPMADDQYSRKDLFEYYRLLLEREEQRVQLKKFLLSLGIEVIPLPSTSDDDVSLNYINAVQDLDSVYVPAFGGMFQDIDRKVLEIVQGSLGSKVKIYPIRNSVTQSQCGGVHCSVSVYGR